MISFVLPLHSFKDINIAVNILFPSIKQFFNLKNLKELIIILNKKDFDCFELVLSKTKIDYKKLFNINVIDEKKIYDKNVKNTYYFQMLLKLLVCKYITTDFYIA